MHLIYIESETNPEFTVQSFSVRAPEPNGSKINGYIFQSFLIRGPKFDKAALILLNKTDLITVIKLCWYLLLAKDARKIFNL